MKVEVLLSCMNHKETSIIQKSNIQSDIVVVNQCDTESKDVFSFIDKYQVKHNCLWINTKERGLSRSRNMAIANATADVCVICDDDEVFEDGYSEIIINAYKQYTNSKCITFIVNRKDREVLKTYPSKAINVGFKTIMQTSSQQITFVRKIVKDNSVLFDTMLGSGTGNGGGEENKFLLDIKKITQIVFYPALIATVLPSKSMWFNGFDAQYMRNQGWSSRRSLGSITGFLYILAFCVRHKKLYQNNISFFCALRNLIGGYFENRNNVVNK